MSVGTSSALPLSHGVGTICSVLRPSRAVISSSVKDPRRVGPSAAPSRTNAAHCIARSGRGAAVGWVMRCSSCWKGEGALRAGSILACSLG